MRPSDGRRAVMWAAACALWLGVWQVASALVGSALLLPGPVEVACRAADLLANATTWSVLGASAARVCLGLAGGLALALALALAAWRRPLVARLLEPPLLVFKSTPVACAIVLLLLWFGSEGTASVVVFLVAFPALYLALLQALGEVDSGVGQMLSTHRVAPWRRFLAHVWPSVVPYAQATLSNACGMAWKAGVAAEVIGSPALGIGERVYHAKLLLETSDVFAWTAFVLLCSWMLERLVLWLLARSRAAALRLALMGLGKKPVAHPLHGAGAWCRALAAGYGDAPVIRGLDLDVAAGEAVCLTDASGAGKTTLLHVLAGLVAPSAGTCAGFAPASMVFQEARLIEGLSAIDNVLLCAGHAATRAEAERALGCVLPGVDLGVPVARLSGGQRRRVELVRALLTPSSSLLLDEPFAALDEDAAIRCARLILCRQGGRPLIIADHGTQGMQALGARAVALHR